jgi:hypothetical protein
VIDDLHFRVRHPFKELVQVETLCSLLPLSEFFSRLLLYVPNLGDGGRVHSVFFNRSHTGVLVLVGAIGSSVLALLLQHMENSPSD